MPGAKQVVLVTAADLAPQAVDLLADYELAFLGKTPTEQDVARACGQTQPVAIIVRYSGVSAAAMDASPKLRVIAKHGTGTDTIDKDAAAKRGIAVRAAVGANADAVAEHTWALVLACAKGIVYLDGRMKQGFWDKSTHKSLELKGKTLGVVGLGEIGRRVAGIGRVFGMRVLGHDPFVTASPEGVDLRPLREVLTAADVVSLNCPLTESNRRMINRESLAAMRDGAILVNTGRGGLVDDDALCEALRTGKLRGAGLDSFNGEPLLGEHRWRGVPNLVLSPHVGGVTSDAYVNMGVAAARNVLDVLATARLATAS